MPRPSQGIGEDRDQNAGQRAGVDKCGPKDGPVVAVMNLMWDRLSGYDIQPRGAQYIYSYSNPNNIIQEPSRHLTILWSRLRELSCSTCQGHDYESSPVRP